MRKLMYVFAGAAALATASVASAASVVTGPVPNPITPPGSAGFFVNVSPTAGATTSTLTPINDTITFNIAGTSGLVDASINTFLLGSLQNVNFTSILLDGTTAFTKTSTDPAPETWALAPTTLAVGSHTINLVGNLTGNVSATYTGLINVQVAPVPEPATWAMMLLGFGAMGLVIRRRRQPVLAQLA